MADVPVYNNDDNNIADARKLFTVNFEVSGIGTTEVPVALFRNPSGSGKLVKLYRLTMSNMHTVSSFIRARLYIAPTVTTDGTALSSACTYIGAAAPTSVAFSSPTVSANGTRVSQYVVPAFSNALIVPLEYAFIMPANTQALLTGQADGSGRVLGGSILWAEV